VTARIQKWGNSLGLRIPKLLAEEIGLREQAEVELTLVKGTLVMRPMRKEPVTLADLLSGVTEENIHGEVPTGPPVGREVW